MTGMTNNGGPVDREDLAMAGLLADAADQISLEVYRSADLLVASKPDASEVTQADLAVEDHLRQLIATHRPEQGVLGEEHGATGSERVRWFIDPIDATRNYVRGLDWWATLLALEVHGKVEVAVISASAMGRRWWAVRGQGAWTTGPLDHRATGPVAPAACRVAGRGDDRRPPCLRRPAGRPLVSGAGGGVLAHPRDRGLLDVVPARRGRGRCGDR